MALTVDNNMFCAGSYEGTVCAEVDANSYLAKIVDVDADTSK